MSYNILQKNIEDKLEKYKRQVGLNYYTYYYYEALDLLDKYILDLANNKTTKSQVKISELLYKANNLQEDKYIYRNYVLSLFIENNTEKLDDILKKDKSIYKEGSFNDEKVIYFLIESFLKKDKPLDNNKIEKLENLYKSLNYIDYRILYVLYKKYNLDILKKENKYLIDSYENKYENIKDGRKTLKTRLAYYSVLDNESIKDEFEMILSDIQYLDGINNITFNNIFIKQFCEKFYKKENILFLKHEINQDNVEIYEYLLQFINKDLYNDYKEMFDYIIQKYCEYRRFNTIGDKMKIDLISHLSIYNENLALLSIYNNNYIKYLEYIKSVELKNQNIEQKKLEQIDNLKNKLRQSLREKTSFTEKELIFIKELDDEYLNTIIQNIHHIEICDITSGKYRIIFKFENYAGCDLEYYDKNAFYYLPEEPKEILVLNDDVLYRKSFTMTKATVNTDFKFKRLSKETLPEYYKEFKNSLANYFCKNPFEVRDELYNDNLSYRFSLYKLYENTDDFIRNIYKNNLKLNKTMVDILIQNKYIFKNKSDYEKILDKIRNSIKLDLYSDQNKEIIKAISIELNDTIKKQDSVYEMIKSIKITKLTKNQNIREVDFRKEKIFKNIVDNIVELDVLGIFPNQDMFIELVKIAYENNYYNNLVFINICEKFIYKYKIVDNIIYQYMRECYKRDYILTDDTKQILNIISMYYDSNDNTKDNLEMDLNYFIKINKYDEEFISKFKNLCKIIKHNDLVHNNIIKRSIDFMTNLNNYNKYIYDLDIAIIMEEVYKYTKGYNKCLEAFIYRYIKNNAIEKIKPYIEDIVSYYTEEKIITDCCMIIVKTIYKYNYYETLNYEKIKLFKKYFLELLKYEMLSYTDYKDLIKDNCILIKNKNNNIIYKFEDVKNENILIKLGYNEVYKINNIYIIREYIIKNKDIFIDEFKFGDDLFKKKAFEVMIEKSIYNKEIVEFALQNERILKDKDQYKKLYMTYLYEERNLDECSLLEYLRSFEYFIDECEIYTDDNKFIENILKKLGESEKSYELDLFKHIDKKHKQFEFSPEYIYYVVTKYSLIDKEDYFIEYFNLNKTRLKEDPINKAFVYYFKSLQYISEKVYKNITNILQYISTLEKTTLKQDILTCIVDTILEKDFYKDLDININKYKYSVLASIHILIYINQIYDYKNDEIYNKIKGIYLYISSFYSKKEEINIFLISKVNDNLNELRELCKFITDAAIGYKFTINEEKIIIKKARELFDKGIKIELEKASSNKYNCKQDSLRQSIVDNYKIIVGNLKSEKISDTYYRKLTEMDFKSLINDLVVSKASSLNNDIIQRYIGFELNNMDEKLLILKVENKNLYKVIKKYLNNQDLDDIYFKDSDNGFENDVIVIKIMDTFDLEDERFNNIYFILDLFIEFVKFESDLLKEDFIIPNLNLQNAVFINNKLFVGNIHQGEVLNVINKRNLKNNMHQNIQTITEIIIKIISQSKLEKKDIYISLIKSNLENGDIDTLDKFYCKLMFIKGEIKHDSGVLSFI